MFAGGVCAFVFVFSILPERICSLGCTIEESTIQRNMYVRSETKIWDRNLGAFFSVCGVGEGVRILPMGGHF